MIVGLLLHAVYSTVLAYALAHASGKLSPTIALVSLVAGTTLSWAHTRTLRDSFPELQVRGPSRQHPVELFVLLVLLYVAARHFLWLVFTSEHRVRTLDYCNYGDLPLHINYIRSFAHGVSFPPHNPSFASELLRYPYGCDLYNALWECLGARLPAHLFLTGLGAALVSLAMLRAYGGVWAMGFFFLSGGLLTDAYFAPSSFFLDSVQWKNLFLSVFVTQRGFLFALPLGIFLLLASRKALRGELVVTTHRGWVLGLLWGFLPLFHLHAFVVVTLLLLAMAVEIHGQGALLALVRFFPIRVAMLPATWFVLFSSGFMKKASVIAWHPGWALTESGLPVVRELMTNFGAFLLVPVALVILAFGVVREGRRPFLVELGVHTALFVLFFFVMLAPSPWDNIKLLIFPYLGFARLLYIALRDCRSLAVRASSVVGFVVLFATGAVCLWRSLDTPQRVAVTLYDDAELARTEGALVNLPPNAVFASTGSPVHTLTYFGRMRALGYEGHLWSHAIDSRAVTAAVRALFADESDGVAQAKRFGVTHVFWGPDERKVYGTHGRRWMGFRNVSPVPEVAIYEVP